MMEHLVLIGVMYKVIRYILRRLYFFKFTTKVLKDKAAVSCRVVVFFCLCFRAGNGKSNGSEGRLPFFKFRHIWHNSLLLQEPPPLFKSSLPQHCGRHIKGLVMLFGVEHSVGINILQLQS